MIPDESAKGVLWLTLVGVIVGLGKLLSSDEVLTARLVLGRLIVSGALGTASAAVVGFLPSLSFAGQMGVAAALASLGVSALEKLFQRLTGN